MRHNKSTWMSKAGFLILSFIISTAIYFSVTTLGQESTEGFSFSSSTSGVYVIENLEIDYRYDKTKYEVVSLGAEPYAVVRGDKALINLLKWSGEPEFFVELTGKPPGNYREQVQFTGIHKDLEVQIYPFNQDLRLMEQQTLSIIPTIEVTGQDKLDKDYIVSVPELLQEEVKIRDIQDRLNQIGQVIGVVDVTNLTKTTTIEVDLEVYDREGNKMEEVNLIDKTIQVTIPIERKVTIIEENIINEIVITEEVVTSSDQPSQDVQGEETSQGQGVIIKQNEKEVDPPKDEGKKPPETPKQEGVISFTNIPSHLELDHKTSGSKWTVDVKINLEGFSAGEYEMTVDDNGEKKAIKFKLTEKTSEDGKEEDTESEETSQKDESNQEEETSDNKE